MADMKYRAAELAQVNTDEEIRLKIVGSGDTATKWLTITADEFDDVAELLTHEA